MREMRAEPEDGRPRLRGWSRHGMRVATGPQVGLHEHGVLSLRGSPFRREWLLNPKGCLRRVKSQAVEPRLDLCPSQTSLRTLQIL